MLEGNGELSEETEMAEIKRNDIEKVKELSPEVYEFLTDREKCNDSTPNGRIDITDRCYAMVSSYETAPRDDKAFESHRKYIDVQMLISGKEIIEIAPIDTLSVTEDYSDEKDCMFYSNETRGDDLILEPMNPVILMPEVGHMPGVSCVHSEKVKKIVVKIPVGE